MLVSAIIPTYNRAHMIGQALESIGRQTYPDIEIIVIDDGSTDNTAEVVENFARNSRLPIKYHRKNNGGCASARNKGLDLITSNLIAFLDSDDAWMPTTIETLVSKLNESGADFVFSPAIEVYTNGQEVLNYPVAAGRPEALAIEHFKNTNVRACAILFKKRVFSIAGKLDENLMHNEDSDFLQKVAILCKAAYSDVPTVKVFHHENQKSNDRVAIFTALLKSSERILTKFPDFKKSLGAIADARILELKFQLAEALITAKNFDKASEIAAPIKSCLNPAIRLSLLIQSTYPLQVRDFWNKLKRHTIKHILR